MAAPVPMTLASAADLIDVSIQEILPKYANLNDDEEVLSLYNREVAEDYYEKDSSLSGFGQASRMLDGSIIASESPVQGFEQTYTQLFHGKMAQFTLYEWKFGIKKRKLEAVVQDLLGSVRRKRATILSEYITASFGAATTQTIVDDKGNYPHPVIGGDGVALINSAHPREDGGSSWSNVVTDGTTSNMDFAPDAIEAAYRTASLIRDPKGNLMDISLDTLICRKGSPVYFKAMEINGALRRDHAPDSAEYNGRPYGAFNVVALPRIPVANENYWLMFDSSLKGMTYGLQYRESSGPTIDAPEADYKTKTIMVSSHAAFDYGHNDGRNFVGSTGTNS